MAKNNAKGAIRRETFAGQKQKHRETITFVQRGTVRNKIRSAMAQR